MPRSRTASALAAFASLVALARPAMAQSTPAESGVQANDDPAARASDDRDTGAGKHWVSRHEIDFRRSDYIVTGAAASVALGAQFVGPHSSHWRGGILFDESARDALRVRSLNGRYAVRDASDVGVSLASTWPFLVDALITAWWYRGRIDLARNMALVSAQTFAIAAAVQSMANDIASRERPYGRLCGGDIPENSVDCESSGRFKSFFSGHATLSFASAGLLCMNHVGLGLLGPAGDTATCASGFAVATMTSVFRIMSDMHYASDVAIGAVFGTTTGLLVPWLHFRRAAAPSVPGSLDVHLAPVGHGLGFAGTF